VTIAAHQFTGVARVACVLMLLLAILAFIAIPAAEIYVILLVGDAIGLWPTVALLLADAVLGAWVVRHQGRSAWRRFRLALAEGRIPAREVLDGGLVIAGGAFLITPGFLTDIAGLVLILPPTRGRVRGALVKRLKAGAAVRVWAARPAGFASTTQRPPGPRDVDGTVAGAPYDVDGTALEADPPQLPRR
jgi:UPF0716 protein FxsA